MKKSLISTLAFLLSALIYSQTPGFRYGGYFGVGKSEFNPLTGIGQGDKLSLGAGIASSKQFTEFFALDVNALFISKGAKTAGFITDGTDIWGEPRTYYYNDIYRLFYIEVPVLFRLSLGFNGFYINGYAGPGINFNLLGTESRAYEDADYNSGHGYSDAPMKNVDVLEFSANYGLSAMIESHKDLFYIDFRFNQAQAPFGKIKGSQSDVYSNYFMIGIGYLYSK